ARFLANSSGNLRRIRILSSWLLSNFSTQERCKACKWRRLQPRNHSVNQQISRANIIGRCKPFIGSFHFPRVSLLCCGPQPMFIPLKDLNPSRTYPFVNITLIFANVVIFLYQVGLEATLPRRAFDALLLSYSTVPARFPAYLAGHVSFE